MHTEEIAGYLFSLYKSSVYLWHLWYLPVTYPCAPHDPRAFIVTAKMRFLSAFRTSQTTLDCQDLLNDTMFWTTFLVVQIKINLCLLDS